MRRITFERATQFLGRNGTFKCTGMVVGVQNDIIFLEPITSKGKTGRGCLEVPVEHADSLIAALRETAGL